MPTGDAKAGQVVIATRSQQHVEIEKAEGVKRLIVRMSDAMFDLDKPVSIAMSGRTLFSGIAPRTIEVEQSTLSGRGDPRLIFDAAVTVTLPAAQE